MLDREYDHQAIQGGDESLEGFDEWREQYRLGEGYVDVCQEEDLADCESDPLSIQYPYQIFRQFRRQQQQSTIRMSRL